MVLLDGEDIYIEKIRVFVSWGLTVLPSFAWEYFWSIVSRWEPGFMEKTHHTKQTSNYREIRGRSAKQ